VKSDFEDKEWDTFQEWLDSIGPAGLKPIVTKVKKGVVKKVTVSCNKKFKAGQYVRVVYRKKPYIGRYAYMDHDRGEYWHVVQFADEFIAVTKDNMIFPVEGLTEKRT
jgi:Ni/Co efflux regulator RcnB